MFFILFIGWLLAPATTSAHAALMLSMQGHGTVDLLKLKTGQTFTVDVVLSGLQSNKELNYLAGTVLFNGSLLGSASNVTAGAIVRDPNGFTGFGLTGLADANYDVGFTSSGRRIATNGTLYSFNVTAQSAGSGFFELDASSLAARDPTNAFLQIDPGAALPYTITDTRVVPEPSSWLVFAVLGIVCLLIRRAQRRIVSRRVSEGRMLVD